MPWYEPQGAERVAAEVALREGGGAGGGNGWLTGHGVPPSGDGMLPLDGINDPWRWSDTWSQWISPAYRVTWTAGDVVDLDASVEPLVGAELDLFIVDVTTLYPLAAVNNAPYGFTTGESTPAHLTGRENGHGSDGLQTHYAPSPTSAYTLVLGDADGVLIADGGSPITVTVPPHADVAFDLGTRIRVLQQDVNGATVAAGAGVTLVGDPGPTVNDGDSLHLDQTSLDVWALTVGPGLLPQPPSTYNGAMTATADGTGIAWLAQAERAWTVDTAVPQPGLDVRDYLGPLMVGELYVFPAADLGVDGNFYLDLDSGTVYHKLTGTWAAVGVLPPSAGGDTLPVIAADQEDGHTYRLIFTNGVPGTELIA